MIEHEPVGARRQLIETAATFNWTATLPELPDMTTARRAAVLILFGALDDIPASTRDAAVARDLDVLLQRRASTLSSHAGEVSFPGGRADDGETAVATALREAEEETGLDRAGVDVLATLPEVPLLASNHRVTPVLSWWRTPSRVAAVDHAETLEVFRAPVARLLDPANRFTSVVHFDSIAGIRTLRTPAFDLDGVIVWGFTATLLNQLFDAIGWTVPWDVGRERVGRPGAATQ